MIYRKALDNFVATELDGELVLMSTETGGFHVLKNTGLSIWKLLDGTRDLGTIQNIVTKEYDVDDETCFSEIESFLSTMVEAGFVEPA